MHKKEAINLNSYDANFKKIISNKTMIPMMIKGVYFFKSLLL